MTIDTEVKTPAETVSILETKLVEATRNQAAATQAFTQLMATGGAGKSLEEQLAISESVRETAKIATNLESSLNSARKALRIAVLDGPSKAVRDAVKAAFEKLGLGKLMADAEAGGTMVITCAVSPESGDVAVSSRFSSAASAPKGESAGGSRSKVAINADGKGYGASEYLEAYLGDAIDSGKVRWGTFEDRMAFTKDHAIRARNLAKVLGHEVVTA